jgi:hypothetical protein
MEFASIVPPQGQGPTKARETNRKPEKCCGGCKCTKTGQNSFGFRLPTSYPGLCDPPWEPNPNKACGSCNSRDRYCDKFCFRLDWKEHRVKCKQTCSWVGCTTEFGNRTTKYKCPCLNKRYCGPVCQKSDWKSGHKNDCEKSLLSAMQAIRATLPSPEELVRRIPPGTSVEEYVGMMKQDFMTKYPQQQDFMTS